MKELASRSGGDAGEVPRGWYVKQIDKIADFLNGLALKKISASNQNTRIQTRNNRIE